MEQLTFKSLLTRFSFDDILPEFKALYRKIRPDLFEQTDWDIYRNVYQDLQTCKEKESKSKYTIQISERWEDLQFIREFGIILKQNQLSCMFNGISLQCFRLIVIKAICCQCRNKIH